MNLREAFDGTVFSLLSLYGGDTSPRLPGEPITRDPTAYLTHIEGGENYDTKSQGLYPKLNRREMLRLMDDMDATDIASSVLDMTAEDATASDADHGPIRVEGLAAVTGPVREMLRNIKAGENLYADCREMCKNGSYFRRLIYNNESGITHAVDVDVDHVEIDRNPITQEIKGYKQSGHMFRDKRSSISFPWDFAHFKLSGQRKYEPYGTPLLAPGIRAWTAMCLAPDTQIWTTRGPVAVKDVQPDDEVYCHNCDTRETFETRVVAVLPMGSQRILRVRTAHREIYVTENHGLLVQDASGAFSYKRAKDLIASHGAGSQTGSDKLVLPSITYGASTHSIRLNMDAYSIRLTRETTRPPGLRGLVRDLGLSTSYKNVHSFFKGARGIRVTDYRRLKSVIPSLPDGTVYYRNGNTVTIGVDGEVTADASFARFFGFMLGDGWLRHGGIGFALGVREDQNQFYIQLASRLFPGATHSRSDGVSVKCAGQSLWHSTFAYDVLTAFGFETGFADKRIPAWVFGMSRDFKMQLLQGLLDADGHDEKNARGCGVWRLKLTNRVLVRQVQCLCQQIGLPVSRVVTRVPECATTRTVPVSAAHPEGRRVVRSQASYRLNIGKTPNPEAVAYENVTHVDPHGVAETFDLQVEDTLHNFIADGVVSHNTMAEDKALTYRIQRQPDRLVFKVDVGTASEAEAWRAIQAYRRSVNRKVVLDPTLSRIRGEYNPLGALENIYLGVRPNSATAIDLLQGSQNTQDVTDLLYYLKKFLTSVRIPPPMFGLPMDTGDQYARNKRLANQDVRYARHIRRIQTAMCDTFMLLAKSHLRMTARDVEDPRLNYDADEHGKGGLKITLRAPSFLEELERLELAQLRNQIANDLLAMTGTVQTIEVFEWTLYVMREVLHLPEDTIKKVIQEPMPPETEGGGGGDDGEPPAPPPQRPPTRTIAAPTAPPSFGRPAPTTPTSGTTPLGASLDRLSGPSLYDNSGYQYTNGGALNEEQIARLERLIGKSPALRNRLARTRILFEK